MLQTLKGTGILKVLNSVNNPDAIGSLSVFYKVMRPLNDWSVLSGTTLTNELPLTHTSKGIYRVTVS